MTQRFILDENVVILAQKAENERGERDLTCLVLLNQIIRICHTVVFDSNLWARCQSQLSRLSGQDALVGIRLLSTLSTAFHTEGKVDLCSNASPFPEEARIPAGSEDDVEIVRLAVETGATLVTTDEALRDDLRSCGVSETYSLKLLSPGEALWALHP